MRMMEGTERKTPHVELLLLYNSTKNGLVVACFVLSLVVLIEWICSIFLIICGATFSSPSE